MTAFSDTFTGTAGANISSRATDSGHTYSRLDSYDGNLIIDSDGSGAHPVAPWFTGSPTYIQYLSSVTMTSLPWYVEVTAHRYDATTSIMVWFMEWADIDNCVRLIITNGGKQAVGTLIMDVVVGGLIQVTLNRVVPWVAGDDHVFRTKRSITGMELWVDGVLTDSLTYSIAFTGRFTLSTQDDSTVANNAGLHWVSVTADGPGLMATTESIGFDSDTRGSAA